MTWFDVKVWASDKIAILSKQDGNFGFFQDKSDVRKLVDPVETSRTAWVKHWINAFPGNAWGTEAQCRTHQHLVVPETRNTWVERDLIPSMPPGSIYEGVEIGACHCHPKVMFPSNVRMKYLDMASDNSEFASHCFLVPGCQKPDTIDDPKFLAKVKNESFDVLLAAHLLEHVHDVLGTLRDWLRVVRPGGLVFVAVPDLCDPKFPFGDRFRLVAKPEHFAHELDRRDRTKTNFETHAAEAAVSLAGVEFLRETLGLPPFNRISHETPPDVNADDVYEVPLGLSPLKIASGQEINRQHPHNVHLHLWSVATMKGMLEAAVPLFAKDGIQFSIQSVVAGGRTQANMQEIRVTLRREANVDAVQQSRAAWEQHWQQDFPGKAWGTEPRCRVHQPGIVPESRKEWVKRELQPWMSEGTVFEGVEIGACQLKVEFPSNVLMKYLDMASDENTLASQCFLTTGSQLPDIIDDAEVLSRVADGKFDLLIAAHVLEHMQNVLGTLRHWLRVVRPGGWVFLAVPDPCDPKFPFGDRFRLAAKPQHFVDEFEHKEKSKVNFPMHAAEAAMSMAATDFLREAVGLPPLDRTKHEMPPNIDADGVYEMPLGLSPTQIDSGQKMNMQHPHNVHVHVWSVATMREMLEAAVPLFARYGIKYSIQSVFAAGRTFVNMQEIRVTLRREAL